MARRLPRHFLVGRAWRSRTGRLLHRALDTAGWQAHDRDRDPGRAPAAGEVSVVTNPRVLLTTLSMRTSARGRPYLSGWLGRASVVAFEGQPDKHGNPTWDVFLAEPSSDGRQKAPASPPGCDPGSGTGEKMTLGALARLRLCAAVAMIRLRRLAPSWTRRVARQARRRSVGSGRCRCSRTTKGPCDAASCFIRRAASQPAAASA
jgi:hypothetical protein